MLDKSVKNFVWTFRITMLFVLLFISVFGPTVSLVDVLGRHRRLLRQHDHFQDHPGLDIHVTRLNLPAFHKANTTVFRCKGRILH